jgi:hypothetical protein
MNTWKIPPANESAACPLISAPSQATRLSTSYDFGLTVTGLVVDWDHCCPGKWYLVPSPLLKLPSTLLKNGFKKSQLKDH